MEGNLLEPELHDLMTRYLLGDLLPDEDQARLEDRYFSDDTALQTLHEIEDDLIDAYVMGRLSGRQLELFNATLQTSERWQRKVAFTKYLLSHLPDPPSGTPAPVPRWFKTMALVAASVAVLAIGVFLRLAPSRISGPMKTPPPALPAISLELLPAGERGAQGLARNDLHIPPGEQPVELRALLTGPSYPEIRARLASSEGPGEVSPHDVAIRVTASPDNHPAAIITVLSSKLRPGTYILKLEGHSSINGWEPIDAYTFNVYKP